jgi:hypothetical protein
MLIEILASVSDQADRSEEHRHRQWAEDARKALDGIAIPGGYPNLLGAGDTDRAAESFGPNAERLIKIKQHYDPDNVFSSAIPLPTCRQATGMQLIEPALQRRVRALHSPGKHTGL